MLFENDSVLFWHLQPGTALKQRCKGFSQSGFRLNSCFAEIFHRTKEVIWCIWPSSDLWTIQEHQWLCQHWVVDTVFRHSNNFLMGMENVLREALFSPLGIKNVFQDTKKFNVDSPMGTKKNVCFLSKL